MAVKTTDMLFGEKKMPDLPDWLEDPTTTAVRLRPVHREGAQEHFAPSEGDIDISRRPLVDKVLRSRKFQFLLILPNQIIFWLVIFSGLVGIADPNLNFGTAITWYVWFCLVFVLMVVVGRAWCSMCPFGGFAEWVQRRTFFKRKNSRPLTLGLKLPERWAGHGLMISLVAFLVLTWIEEYFGIAGPGNPRDTSFMVIGIVAAALLIFLVFERRTFCRYICPLSSLIGSVGAAGMAAGFRTRDREICLDCKTKECMRGGENGYGCPWYTWPGSADSNLMCGLCSECYKACPSGNVGLFLQRPLKSVVAPMNRRYDVAWAVAFLTGLVVYQQLNALSWYTPIDNRFNRYIHEFLGIPTSLLHYPNVIVYVGMIAGGAFLLAGMSWLIMNAARMTGAQASFRKWFAPLMYGIIPVVGMDYFARQLPKFFQDSPALVPAVIHPFGGHAPKLAHYAILTNWGVIYAQLAVMALGTAASLYVMWRISKRDLEPLSQRPQVARMASLAMVLALGFGLAVAYLPMHAAH
jgi:NosR/NirI family nitrous oxide reductase transcriptional regulator